MLVVIHAAGLIAYRIIRRDQALRRHTRFRLMVRFVSLPCYLPLIISHQPLLLVMVESAALTW
jgi:hypothetical protein